MCLNDNELDCTNCDIENCVYDESKLLVLKPNWTSVIFKQHLGRVKRENISADLVPIISLFDSVPIHFDSSVPVGNIIVVSKENFSNRIPVGVTPELDEKEFYELLTKDTKPSYLIPTPKLEEVRKLIKARISQARKIKSELNFNENGNCEHFLEYDKNLNLAVCVNCKEKFKVSCIHVSEFSCDTCYYNGDMVKYYGNCIMEKINEKDL